MDLKKQRIELAVTGLMLGLASYLQYIAYHTKARTNVQGMQSMTFPKIILYLMMFLCAVTLIRGIITYRKLKKEMTSAPSASQKGQATKIIVTILLIVVYAAMWNVIGFFVSTLIFFFRGKYAAGHLLLVEKSCSPFHFVRYCRLCGFRLVL